MQKLTKIIAGICLAFALTSFVANAAEGVAVKTTPAKASDQWTFTLAGAGNTSTKGSSDTVVGGEFSIGRRGNLVLPLEVGVRQGIGYASAGNSFLFGTSVYSDFTVLKLGILELQAGANVRANYGDQSLSWSAAPELVGKVYLKKDVYAYARADYAFDLNSGQKSDTIGYNVGVGFSF